MPGNNNFATAQTISGGSGIVAGTNIGATVESFEPLEWSANPAPSNPYPNINASPIASVWYKWTCPATDSYFFSTESSATDFMSVVDVFTADTTVFPPSFTFIDYDFNQTQGVGYEKGARVAFQATKDVVYYIRVDCRANEGFYKATFVGVQNNITGINYTVGDILSMVGGVVVQGGSVTTAKVTQVIANGIIQTVILQNAGAYRVQPTGTGATGGTGTGANLGPLFQFQPAVSTGNFRLSWGKYFREILGACDTCPTDFDSASCLSSISFSLSSVKDAPVNLSLSFGRFSKAAGLFKIIYCSGGIRVALSPDDIEWFLTFGHIAFQSGGGGIGEISGANYGSYERLLKFLFCSQIIFCHAGGEISSVITSPQVAEIVDYKQFNFRLTYTPMWPSLSFVGNRSMSVPYNTPVYGVPITGKQGVHFSIVNNSSSLTWPNVQHRLVSGVPGILQDYGNAASANIYPGDAGNSPFTSDFFVYDGDLTDGSMMPYTLNFETSVCGVVAGYTSRTVQPTLVANQPLITDVNYSGSLRKLYAIRNNNIGYGFSNHPKMDVSVISGTGVLLGTSTIAGGGTPNQSSLSNVPVLNGAGDNLAIGQAGNVSGIDTQLDAYFISNKLDGKTPVTFQVAFRDDTHSYPPLIFSVIL